MILPRPRAYVDWAVPLDDQGNEIGVCHDTKTYLQYLDWLADYLFNTDIPIPENQRGILVDFENEGGISSAVFWLSDDWGYSLLETEWIENGFLEGFSYDEFHSEEVNNWNALSDEARATYEEPDKEIFTSEEEYNRIGQEAVESKKVPVHIKHADIAYRPIFAKLLKKVKNKQDRIAYLDYFYRNFNDCASK